MSRETSIGGSKREFVSTLWTLVLKARQDSPEALEELIQAYWKPIYFYIRRWGAGVDDAKDLCQGFFSMVLERRLLKGVSREKGRFRAYLLTALKHYLINEAERAQAQKRGGGKTPLSLDYARVERDYGLIPASQETPERIFNRQWAVTTMSRTLEAVRKEMDAATFEAVKPHLAGGPAYTETARKLGITVTQLNNLIHRTRKRYRELLRMEVAQSLSDPANVERELRNILEALKR